MKSSGVCVVSVMVVVSGWMVHGVERLKVVVVGFKFPIRYEHEHKMVVRTMKYMVLFVIVKFMKYDNNLLDAIINHVKYKN